MCSRNITCQIEKDVFVGNASNENYPKVWSNSSEIRNFFTMGRNYELLLCILKKWPVDSARADRDFGSHLRKLAKNAFPEGNIFDCSEDENNRMLKSLLRLANNTYGSTYSSDSQYVERIGACGLNSEDLKKHLNDESILKKIKN